MPRTLLQKKFNPLTPDEQVDLQLTAINREIRVYLLRQGKQSRDLAKWAGVSDASISKRLTGLQDWKLSELLRVSIVTGTSLENLLNLRQLRSEDPGINENGHPKAAVL